MGSQSLSNNKTLTLVAVALFAIAAVAHIALGWFPKCVAVMPDEYTYLDIARSLSVGAGIQVHGLPSDFEKILYPLLLLPAMLFQDSQSQVQAITVLNSLYICSSVFPVLVLARSLFQKRSLVIASMVFAVISPDLMFAMGFMSEVAYIPVSLWLVCLVWACFQAENTRELGLAFASGAVCYVAYLCKEVALMFAVAFVAWYFVAAVKGRKPKRQVARVLGVFAVGLLGCYAIGRYAFFLGGSLAPYAQVPAASLSPYSALFSLYALLVNSVHVIIAFGVFPVLYVAFAYRDMPQRERDLAFFCLAALIIGMLITIGLISLSEDLGHAAIRQHIRYVCPLILPILMLFMKQVDTLDFPLLLQDRRRFGAFVAMIVMFCVLSCVYVGTANVRGYFLFDNNQFHIFRLIDDAAGSLAPPTFNVWQSMGENDAEAAFMNETLPIDPLVWLARVLVVVFTLAGTWLLTRSERRMRIFGGRAICGVMAALMIVNAIAAVGPYHAAYDAGQGAVDEICAIDAQLSQRDEGEEVMIVMDDIATVDNKLIDTYFQNCKGDSFFTTKSALDAFAEGNADVAESGMDLESAKSFLFDPVDYVLANTSQDLDLDAVFDAVEEVEVEGAPDDGRFVVYRVSRTA